MQAVGDPGGVARYGDVLVVALDLGRLVARRRGAEQIPELADVVDADVVALVQVEPEQLLVARHHESAER